MYDYHTHTSYSDDCSTPMKDMIEQACAIGLTELAITDHYDPDYPDKDYPFDLAYESYQKALIEAQEKYKNRIKIVKGVEIGIQHGNTLKKCEFIAGNFPYDFVLGSFHCAEGFELYGNSYFLNRSTEDSYLAFYQYMYDCLKLYKNYDVLGHFNIIDRYSNKMPSPSLYMDIVETILKLIIDDGKGIEINTSSFRYGMGERTTPAKEILQLYKDLGGEIITTGSDAHKPEDLGYQLEYAEHMIKSAGIRYITTFENRVPKFIKLD
ncbi:histidinol-phosphatase HisJ family protein [Sinanaerobacter chloroacetimidivorans]|jgi:histidinol-phosphatase (PHP family)|uniref:Histidinol-phosphatase n=1 Tax=Sinanaerobacter chloroacetimidivorans TaxID=2818044 RepID=A0A8J7VXR7_9FIRM|nr:histidinol-phosphatase HisJ family protein [Sinanaerobacter chloroacetimidivorans]MBR0596704.1 histidinol-phosphatase HisJ family protein [Sinanaerobacter chloroacetimidivorans]